MVAVAVLHRPPSSLRRHLALRIATETSLRQSSWTAAARARSQTHPPMALQHLLLPARQPTLRHIPRRTTVVRATCPRLPAILFVTSDVVSLSLCAVAAGCSAVYRFTSVPLRRGAASRSHPLCINAAFGCCFAAPASENVGDSTPLAMYIVFRITNRCKCVGSDAHKCSSKN